MLLQLIEESFNLRKMPETDRPPEIAIVICLFFRSFSESFFEWLNHDEVILKQGLCQYLAKGYLINA